jgi:hypothetical protein
VRGVEAEVSVWEEVCACVYESVRSVCVCEREGVCALATLGQLKGHQGHPEDPQDSGKF